MNAAAGQIRSSRTRPQRGGFTLIEVMVTLVLMGIVLPITMRGISISIAAASFARHEAEAATLGQTKLNEIVSNWILQVDSVPPSGDFGPGWNGYTFKTTQADDSTISVTTITLSVVWLERGQERTLDISTMVQDPT